MIKNSSQMNANQDSSLWQSLPFPQKSHLINLVAELVQRQLTLVPTCHVGMQLIRASGNTRPSNQTRSNS